MINAEQSSLLKRALTTIEDLQRRLAQAGTDDPVAVVGIGCRLPGGVESPEDFWELLMAGKDGIIEVPQNRWDTEHWYHPDRDEPGKMNMQKAGFLRDGIDRFDAGFFGIAPREAVEMDPQQRLLLEVSWEALENAACPPPSLKDTDCGVFLGVYNNNYTLTGRGSPAPESIGGWSASGAHSSIAAGRLSYFLGLHGPSLAIDTACSSSLVAVHLAVRSLQNGECNMALAGGAHLLLAPEAMVASTKLGATSPDGRCKTFDAAADGFGHGEGCGILVLKKLSDALQAGDQVMAVIRGSAVNQDGRSNSLTAPNGPAQEAVIAKALANAGLQAHSVDYVEAHGTGTPLGDPIEIEALAAAYGDNRNTPLMIGSVKTNLGHLEAAAGIAGLIKAILCTQNGIIPPHLNLKQRNPEIDTGPVDILIPTEATTWQQADGRRIAGVSAFGFGGTNAHMLLESAPSPSPLAKSNTDLVQVLPLSARSPDALAELSTRWTRWLQTSTADIADISATAATGRAHFLNRIAVVGKYPGELADALRLAKSDEVKAIPQIAFLFTGQGSQYTGMAKRAYQVYPVFRETLDRCMQTLDKSLKRPALALLFGDEAIDTTSLAQPLVVAVELALAALWDSWGVKPIAVMGHSLGEYTAAVVASALTEEEALLLVSERGRLMQELPANGAMLAAFTTAEKLQPVIESIEGILNIAAYNGPVNTVVSGEIQSLEILSDKLNALGIESRRLDVSHAFHSPLLAPALPGLDLATGGLGERQTQLPLVSNLTGEVVDSLDSTHWRAHAQQPVRFAAGLETLQDLGCDTFVEIGPHPVLSTLGPMVLDDATWISSLRRGKADDAELAQALAKLYCAGAGIDWSAVHENPAARKLVAPTYPFQRHSYWLDVPRVTGTTAAPLKAVATAAKGSSLVYDFYDELTMVSRTYELGDATTDEQHYSEEEAHLTFGFLPKPVAGFSWLRALFEKQENLQNHALFKSSQRELKDALFNGIDFSRMQRVFDYGCGHAADLCSLAMRYPWLQLQGFTLSAGQVALGTERIKSLQLQDRVRVHRNDSSAVAFPGHFDLIFGFEVTGLIADKDGLFDNVVDHLAPGGLLVIADFVATGDPIANPETNSFTPSHEQWINLLSQRKLRLVRSVDSSQEIANWLDDPDFTANVNSLSKRFGFGELTHRHLLSNGNIGKALRADLMRYLLLTAQYSPHETEASIRQANQDMLHNALLYRDVAGNSEYWHSWLYAIEWQQTANSVTNVDTASLATSLKSAVEKEKSVLDGFGNVGALLDQLSLDYTIAAFRELGCADLQAAITVPVADSMLRLRDRLVKVMTEQGLDKLESPGDIDSQCAQILASHPEAEAELTLLRRCGPVLATALTGQRDPLELLFPGGDASAAERLYQHSPYSQAVQRLAAEAVATLPRNQPLAVLEIGGGTGATTSQLLAELPAGSRYLFTDLGASLVARAKGKFADSSLEFSELDISRPPADQGIATGSWDLVVAANVLHATPDLSHTLKHVHELLAPGGLLLMIENTGRLNWGDLTFGLTEGMWNFTDTELRDYALLYQDQWRELIASSGFETPAILTPGDADQGGISQQCLILARRNTSRHWLLAGDSSEFTDTLADALSRQGDRCSRLALDVQADSQLLSNISDLVYLGAIDSSDPLDQQSVLSPVLALTQALAGLNEPPHLHLISNGSQAIENAVTPAQATLLGFGRTLMGELAEVHTRLIDLDPAASTSQQAAALAQELIQGNDAEIALRGKERLTPSLIATSSAAIKELQFNPAVSYIISGAFGGLGLKVAQWMANHGARNLILAGRSAPSIEAEAILEALRAQGVNTVTMSCDLGQLEEVRSLVNLAQQTAPLKGVIHAAGALADAGLINQSWDKFETVLKAKLHGSWHLHQLTKQLQLDHFVLFSSAASLLGPAGQSNHAAANSFVDALAHARQQQGLPAVAINWGAWAKIGAATKQGIEEKVESSGLIHMDPDQALQALSWAMSQSKPQVAIIDAHWGDYQQRFPRGGVPTLLSELASVAPARSLYQHQDKPDPTTTNDLRQHLAEAAPLRRMDLLLDHIRSAAGEVMGLDDHQAIADHSPLREMGLDSLMSVELRNTLAASFAVKLPATLLFDHPSLTALADYLAMSELGILFRKEAPDEQTDELGELNAEQLAELLATELDQKI